MTTSLYPQLPVLMVDDEVQALNSFEMALRSASMTHIIRCEDSRRVMEIFLHQEIEVMMLDLSMPHVSGEELLLLVTKEYPEVPVIVITGSNDVDTAVACMKTGAFDYMVKPVEKSRLISGVKRAIELRELQRENRLLRAHVLSDKLEHPEAFSEIVTHSLTMRSIFQYIESISVSPQPILITGETGVGKELVAKAIHQLSQRKGAFVPVNVAGLDDNVFADTLFGHKKGAFTGADQARSGLVEQGSGGTLFLDEIGDLSAPSQVKLLRLLQDGEYFPLGADVGKRSDARVVVATNQDIHALQEVGKFRKDLYYRLCGHQIHIPPLRERREDLPILLDHFLEKASETLGKKKPTPPRELLTLLSTYRFPGNVRELQSIILDAVSSHKSGKLSMEVFKSYIRQRQPTLDIDSKHLSQAEHLMVSFSEPLPTFKQSEQLLVSEAMKRASGNQAIAAQLLGITRQALNKRLKRGGQ
ncbi:MAG: two-component system response regulator [Deltaproteobacteria bacterium RBG_13_47_9]|nr:MAG: two-component system response regulator [Deltaproteobacteria bacterium RBG_13_47_9]